MSFSIGSGISSIATTISGSTESPAVPPDPDPDPPAFTYRSDNKDTVNIQLEAVMTQPWAWDTSAFWKQKALGTVDTTRTTDLADSQWNVPVKMHSGHYWSGTVHGIPYQVAQTTGGGITVWDETKLMGDPDITVNLHYPDGFVRTEDQPSGSGDHHSILIDLTRNRMIESFVMRPNVLGFWGASWVGQLTRWNTSVAWASTSGGTNAAKIPYFPLLPRREEFEVGVIAHMLPLVMDRYNSALATGTPARGGDGLSSLHPVRSGEKMRLKSSSLTTLSATYSSKPHILTLLTCLREYGVIVMDKNTMNNDSTATGRCVISSPQEAWFADTANIGEFTASLSDFEVVSWS